MKSCRPDPAAGKQRIEHGRKAAQGIVGNMRIGGVALLAEQGQTAGQRAAASVLDRVPELFEAGWFADDAMVEIFGPFPQPIARASPCH